MKKLAPLFLSLWSWITGLFNSKNGFFLQDTFTLKVKQKDVRDLLFIKGYEEPQIELYMKAYDYFTYHREEFDGATMTEDLYDIPQLDLDGMFHDWPYIRYNVAGNYKYMWLVDLLIRSEMRKKGKSTINAGLRFVLLLLKTLIGYPVFCYLFKGRRMSADDKAAMDRILRTMNTGRKRHWWKEFRGEITVSAIIMLIMTLLIW